VVKLDDTRKIKRIFSRQPGSKAPRRELVYQPPVDSGGVEVVMRSLAT